MTFEVALSKILNTAGLQSFGGDGDDRNPAESARILRWWKVMLHGSCGDGNGFRGTPLNGENLVGLLQEYSSIWILWYIWSSNISVNWNYTVSQKTSHLWFAITSTHMNRFW